MRLAWLTDIHLNFVDGIQRRRFLESVSDQCDAVTVSGDIGESHDVAAYLGEMDEFVEKPVYFVLGNHDFYRGSIAKTRLMVAEVAQESKHLEYLTASGVIELTPKTAIVGHDGWADGRLGDYENTEVILNDHLMIAEISRWCDDFLPYFACKAVGDVLTRIMQAHPQSSLTVLCGHTHGGGEIQVLDNLRVLTGEARYGQPKVERILEIE